LGHDKAASIQEYRTIASSESEDGSVPLIIFVGDGVSDLAAAREADVLFARRGLRLEEYCRESHIPHISFDTFKDIQAEIIRIMKEDTKKTAGAGKPMHYNPRANFWRKAIKKKNVPFTYCINRVSSSYSSLRVAPGVTKQFGNSYAYRNNGIGLYLYHRHIANHFNRCQDSLKTQVSKKKCVYGQTLSPSDLVINRRLLELALREKLPMQLLPMSPTTNNNTNLPSSLPMVMDLSLQTPPQRPTSSNWQRIVLN
jgi:hypothetical protein